MANCGSIKFAAINVVPDTRTVKEFWFAAFANVRVKAESGAVLSAWALKCSCIAALSTEYAGGTSDAGCPESGR